MKSRFSIGKGNGFHSRPIDPQGNIIDETLDAPALVGKQVWIH